MRGTGDVIALLLRTHPHNQKLLLLPSASRNVTATRRFALKISRQHLNLAEIGRGR